MKSSLLLSIFLIVCQLTYCQDFITKWTFDRAKSGIKFSALTSDTVHYTWTANPSGSSGNGSFIQTTPAPVILIGLNVMAGDTVVLNMESDNLNRFYFENGQDQRSLFDVSQWGDVAWTSMHKTFFWTSDLIISASDSPDLSNVTDMSRMFSGASSINADIGDWDVSNVTNMRSMFSSAKSFNKDISNWDVSNVTDMGFMFFGTDSFNQNIGNWDVSNVTDMTHMFFWATSFNQDINRWDVSNVTNMGVMFFEARSFNQDINKWDVSNATIMRGMFRNADSFNQDIGDWKIHPEVNMNLMFNDSGMDCDHYSVTLIGWHNINPSVTDITLGASGLEYGTSAIIARDSLINEQGWTIEGDEASGMDCDAFIDGENQEFVTQWTFDVATTNLRFSALTTDTVHYTWTVSPSGNSGNGSFIQITPDSVTLNGLNIVSGDTLNISMAPENLSRFYFEEGQDQESLIDVSQWGDVAWTRMSKAFSGCRFLNISAIDTPNLSNVTRMDSMFYEASGFNDDIGHWDVSNVRDMSYMFSIKNAGLPSGSTFNQDIGDWDVSNVRDMSYMFGTINSSCIGCEGVPFNYNIGQWNVSNVTDMKAMFYNASSFNQDIGDWDVSNVTDMSGMFSFAYSFNQKIGGWDVSSVTDMSSMFSVASSFNQEIGGWDVSNVTDISSMFNRGYSFNQDIGGWDVSNVNDMGLTFSDASIFNQNIGNWDVSNVTNMAYMFEDSDSFNQNIGDWDVSNVTNMQNMFRFTASFNQDIGGWDVSSVISLRKMFSYSRSFSQDIGNWILHPDVNLYGMLDSSGMDCDHYSATLVGWQKSNPSVTDVLIGVIGLQYGDSAVPARNSLINEQGWRMSGDVASNMECNELVSADYTASNHRLTIYPNPASDQIFIPMNNVSYKIISADGRVLQDGVIQGQQITLENLSVGLYILQVFQELEVYQAKFLKQ